MLASRSRLDLYDDAFGAPTLRSTARAARVDSRQGDAVRPRDRRDSASRGGVARSTASAPSSPGRSAIRLAAAMSPSGQSLTSTGSRPSTATKCLTRCARPCSSALLQMSSVRHLDKQTDGSRSHRAVHRSRRRRPPGRRPDLAAISGPTRGHAPRQDTRTLAGKTAPKRLPLAITHAPLPRRPGGPTAVTRRSAPPIPAA